jgi:hypothetical protein
VANKSAPMLSVGGYESAITAAGSSISDAASLSGAVNIITTAAASSGVKLPDLGGPMCVVAVVNKGANTVNVYPPSSSGSINGGSAGAAVTIATNKAAVFFSTGTGTWLHVAGA